jgi:hypothetical protein
VECSWAFHHATRTNRAPLIPTRIKTDTPTKKGSISFLKKRNKKLLLFAPSRRLKWANQVLPFIGKSFLFLFFKKELLPSACLPFSLSRSQHAGITCRAGESVAYPAQSSRKVGQPKRESCVEKAVLF